MISEEKSKVNLNDRLSEIQRELKAPKNQFNAFGKYKYRSCEDILEGVKPLLNGLVLTLDDEIKEMLGHMYIESTAAITDGQSVISVKAQAGLDPNRKGMDIAQCFGSSSSYARKYALNGLLLTDDTKDADCTNDHSSKTLSLEDVEKKLRGCKNMKQLQSTFQMLPPSMKAKLLDVKDEMKKKLQEDGE